MTKAIDPLILLQKKNERLTLELAAVRSTNKKLLRSGGFAVDNFIDEFREVLAQEKQSPFAINLASKKVPATKAHEVVGTDHEEIATIVWSDWHLSEVVKINDSNRINTYNSLIAANRVHELVQKNIKIIKLHRSMYPIKKIWLNILGDMINGSIHPELVLTNDLSDPAAAILCSRLLQMAILELQAELDLPIEVDCIVGNHPRMTAKMPTKVQAQTSYDWMIYETLADVFKHNPRVSIRIHTGQIGLVEQFGWRYVIEHGIDIASGKEEDLEDRIRSVFDDAIYRRATGLKGASFDVILIGNMHRAKFLERTIVNGTLVGQNELGMSWRLKPIKASQAMFGISRGYPRTWQYMVEMTSVTSDKPSNHYSQYTLDFMKKFGKGRN